MENPTLTSRWYSGLTVPELWYIYAHNGSIFIVFTQLCWNILQSMSLENESSRPHEKQIWGFEPIFPPVTKTKVGTYWFCISIENQKDTTERIAIAKSLSFLTEVLHISVMGEAAEKRHPFQGEQVQLFSLETHFAEHTHFHAAAMDVSISPEAAEFLDQHSMSVIPGVHQAMKTHHLALYPQKKVTDLTTELRGVIREEGTLSFVTYGNCACLGHMPEKIKKDGGLYIDSHNLDTPWQQLSMLVGVATTWRWVRGSLGYK